MSSANPVRKAKDAIAGAINPIAAGFAAADALSPKFGQAASDLAGSAVQVARSPRRLAGYTVAGLPGFVASLARDAGRFVRTDQQNQAEGQAQADQREAQGAADAAAGAAPKPVDILALARRRALIAGAPTGRAGTILTGGTSLGSPGLANQLLGN